MDWGRYTLGERAFRCVVLAVVGAVLSLILILRIDMKRWSGPSYILPAILVGALIGGTYGFFRNRP
jgi:hypothetical protein